MLKNTPENYCNVFAPKKSHEGLVQMTFFFQTGDFQGVDFRSFWALSNLGPPGWRFNAPLRRAETRDVGRET